MPITAAPEAQPSSPRPRTCADGGIDFVRLDVADRTLESVPGRMGEFI